MRPRPRTLSRRDWSVYDRPMAGEEASAGSCPRQSAMPDFALKAAAIDHDQLAARAEALVGMNLPIRLELHTFGPRDIDEAASRRMAYDNIARLRDRHTVESLVVHVPLQSVAIVTRQDFDFDQCARAIDFAHSIDAAGVVVHRYYALVHGDDPVRIASREEAARAFERIVARLARRLGPRRLLVENVGHYSLLPRDGRSFLSGPLDHFFPWEIERFRDFLRAEKLTTVEPFVDIAHATLSANLFNRRRADPGGTEKDPRFRWIDHDDLARSDWLEPFDFVDADMPYLHVSDAIRLERQECAAPVLAETRLTRSIVTEGLELGLGTLPIGDLPGRFGRTGDLVMEVDPGAGDTHVTNGAQTRSLAALRRVFAAGAAS